MHTYKKFKPQIWAFIKKSFFGTFRDPCFFPWHKPSLPEFHHHRAKIFHKRIVIRMDLKKNLSGFKGNTPDPWNQFWSFAGIKKAKSAKNTYISTFAPIFRRRAHWPSQIVLRPWSPWSGISRTRGILIVSVTYCVFR